MPDRGEVLPPADVVLDEIFSGLVVDWERYGNCPTQVEGTLREGRRFYFRYRHGRARLGLGNDIDAAVDDCATHSIQYGDELAGSLTDDEFKELFIDMALPRLISEGATGHG